MKEPVTVIKLNPAGQETWRYSGFILDRTSHAVVLEARFNRDDLPFHEILLKQNDRFVETYYSERWYNIFEIHDRDDDQIKGWYCNVTEPAVFQDGQVSYVDLALDLLVYPDGRQLVLDEDEFEELNITEALKEKALLAMEELKRLFRK